MYFESSYYEDERKIYFGKTFPFNVNPWKEQVGSTLKLEGIPLLAPKIYGDILLLMKMAIAMWQLAVNIYI